MLSRAQLSNRIVDLTQVASYAFRGDKQTHSEIGTSLFCLLPSVLCLLVYIASAPVSPVRTRRASSTGITKILPSPILPVLADSRMQLTTC